MNDKPDNAQVIVHPPVALTIAIVVGLALDQLIPLPLGSGDWPHGWIGATVFLIGLALLLWAVVAMKGAGTTVPTNTPTTAIVEEGPYRITRNPIYVGMLIGQIGLAVAFNTLWLLIMLAPFALVIRYGVVAREEAYLEHKFGEEYRAYRSRVRRWF